MANTFKPCCVDGCNKNSHYTAKGAKGMCVAHYTRWRRFGDVNVIRSPRGKARAFFETVVLSWAGEDCLIWPFSRNQSGYAILAEGRASRRVPRLVCERMLGPAPSVKHEAAHSCGRGQDGCVNPTHLRWALPVENAADKVLHGTANRGSKHIWAKLNDSQVQAIRKEPCDAKLADIAAKYGMSRTAIRQIRERKTWAWLK